MEFLLDIEQSTLRTKPRKLVVIQIRVFQRTV